MEVVVEYCQLHIPFPSYLSHCQSVLQVGHECICRSKHSAREETRGKRKMFLSTNDNPASLSLSQVQQLLQIEYLPYVKKGESILEKSED